MISIEPQTTIVLCTVPWEEDYKNQRTFTDATAQATYFNGLSGKQTFTDFTYQRKDGTITVGANIESLRNFNYVYYTNTGFTNKIFYAFITDMTYVSENSTRLNIETDVFQTWQFNLVYNKCFVEREHVTNDTIGLHTYPEQLETGEYIVQTGSESASAVHDLLYLEEKYIVVGITRIPNFTTPASQHGRMYNGIYSGLIYLVFRDGKELDYFIQAVQGVTGDDAIYSIFMVPKTICVIPANDWTTFTIDNISFEAAFYPYTNTATDIGSFYLVKESTLAGNYTPKNNKLYCYPYRYFLISNNCGSVAEYKYELFSTNTCEFQIKGTVNPGCSIKIIPQSYKEGSLIKSLDAGKLPTCTWYSDSYTNWLTQNSVNIPFEVGMGIVNTAIGTGLISSGAGAIAGTGMVLGGISAIGGVIGNNYAHSTIPPTAKGGVNQGDLMFARKETFSYYKMSIKKEYAEIIDNYFEMFGYKVCVLKTPNITGRPYWNYVKTIDCNFEGDIPNADLLLIRRMFDNGVTLWYTNDMYDYTKNNH